MPKQNIEVKHEPNQHTFTYVMLNNTVKLTEKGLWETHPIPNTTVHDIYQQFSSEYVVNEAKHKLFHGSCWLTKKIMSEEDKINLRAKHPRTEIHFHQIDTKNMHTITKVYNVPYSHKNKMLRHFLLEKDENGKYYYLYPDKIEKDVVEKIIQESRDKQNRDRRAKEELINFKVQMMLNNPHD